MFRSTPDFRYDIGSEAKDKSSILASFSAGNIHGVMGGYQLLEARNMPLFIDRYFL